MEDPVRFDIYGVVNPDERELAPSELRRLNPMLDEAEARKQVRKFRLQGDMVLIAGRLSWSRVHEL